MTFDEFRILIKPLAVHFGAVKDPPTWKLYHAALMAEPAPSPLLVGQALVRSANTRKFFPSVAELREDCEAERQAVLAANKHELCFACRGNYGWLEEADANGVARVRRCPCFDRHQRKLAMLGVGTAPLTLALPPPFDDSRALETGL